MLPLVSCSVQLTGMAGTLPAALSVFRYVVSELGSALRGEMRKMIRNKTYSQVGRLGQQPHAGRMLGGSATGAGELGNIPPDCTVPGGREPLQVGGLDACIHCIGSCISHLRHICVSTALAYAGVRMVGLRLLYVMSTTSAVGEQPV